MSEEKLPGWIRFLDIIIGLIVIILGAVVLYSILFPGFLVQEWIVYILGIIFLLYGIYMMIKSFVAKGWTMGFRALYFIVGVLFLGFGILAFMYTLLALAIIVIFFGIAVMLYGVLLIVVGFAAETKGWIRGLVVIIGFVLLIAGIIFIFYWATAGSFWWLVVIAVALIFEGVGRLIVGITGETY